IILARLEQLPPPPPDPLEMAAAPGRDFPVDLLENIATFDPLPALNLLLQRQFLVELESGRLGFSHRLVQEVIYTRLSPLVRRRLHQRVADALIARHGQQAGPQAAAIADHSFMAGPACYPQAVAFAVRAGDHAMRAFGFEEAAQHYRHALDIAADLPPSPPLESHIRQAYQGLGLAQESLAAWEDARQTYEEWQRWAQTHHHPELALMAQHKLASMLGLIGQIDQSAAISARISRRLPPDTPPALADAQRRLERLISHRVNPPAWTSAGWPLFTPQPVRLVRPWEEIAAVLGEEQAIQTLNLYGWALTLQGNLDAAEATLHYAGRLAEGYGQAGLQATSLHLLAQLWDLRGDYTAMADALEEALSLVERMPPMRWAVLWGLIHQAYVDLRWNRLERAERRLLRLQEELAGRNALCSHQLSVTVGLGLLAMFRQNLEEAARHFDAALSNAGNLYASNYVVVYLSRARIHRKYGRLEEAQEAIMHAMTFAGERGMLADYISAVVEAARFDRATDQPQHVIPLLQQAEAMASQAGMLPARLSTRQALFRVFRHLRAADEAAWYRRLARADRDAIAATIPAPADRAAYLARHDFESL
ncbi:MAG: hypothetical protein D6796_15470, partial [Caldilineae bacterium]